MWGIPTVAQWVKDPTSIHEDVGSVPGLTQWLRIQHCCELRYSCRCSLDLALLWPWCKPAAAAPIRSLVWELPYASCVALKNKKRMNQNVGNVIPPNKIRARKAAALAWSSDGRGCEYSICLGPGKRPHPWCLPSSRAAASPRNLADWSVYGGEAGQGLRWFQHTLPPSICLTNTPICEPQVRVGRRPQ